MLVLHPHSYLVEGFKLHITIRHSFDPHALAEQFPGKLTFQGPAAESNLPTEVIGDVSEKEFLEHALKAQLTFTDHTQPHSKLQHLIPYAVTATLAASTATVLTRLLG